MTVKNIFINFTTQIPQLASLCNIYTKKIKPFYIFISIFKNKNNKFSKKKYLSTLK